MIQTSKTTKNDNWMEVLGIRREKIHVLIIGNNPIEMTQVYNTLITNTSKNYLADVCFDVKDSFDRITKNKPQVILIDDNILLEDINRLNKVLKSNSKTSDIKLIVLKSSNWSYQVVDNVDDYILKDTVNSGLLDKLIHKNLHQDDAEYA